MVGTTNTHLVCTSDTNIIEPSEIVEVTNPRKYAALRTKKLLEVLFVVLRCLVLRKESLQEGWLEIYCQYTSPYQFII